MKCKAVDWGVHGGGGGGRGSSFSPEGPVQG